MDKNNYHISSVIQSYLEELDRQYRNEDQIFGLSTGIKKLDDKLKGLRDGEIILLAARPGVGRTSFAINLSYKIANSFLDEKEANPNSHKCVLYFSMMKSKLFLIQRLISSKIPDVWAHQLSNFKYGTQSYEEFEKIANVGKELEKLPIYICDGFTLSINDIKDKIKEISQHSTIGFIVIDTLQLIFTENNSDFHQNLIILQELKNMATKFNVPILILSYLNQDADNRKDHHPLLSDIKGYHTCISYIDRILFLYRESYYLEWNEPKKTKKETVEQFQNRMKKWKKQCKETENECEFIVAKNRLGVTGAVKCFCDLHKCEFKDLPEEKFSDRIE